MRRIFISDRTMNYASDGSVILSFREKIELAGILDQLGVDSIETGPVSTQKTDSLLIKSLHAAAENSVICIQVPPVAEEIRKIAASIRDCGRIRLQLSLPVSTVQMEYRFHLKPDAMLSLITDAVSACHEQGAETEFCAQDAGRASEDFLHAAIEAAVNAGAGMITLCDTAGSLLPEEFGLFVARESSLLRSRGIRVGAEIADTVYLASACAIEAVAKGADEVKVVSAGHSITPLLHFATALHARGETLGAGCALRMTELNHVCDRITSLCSPSKGKGTGADNTVREGPSFQLSVHDTYEAVSNAVEKLGYDLSESDMRTVYDAFLTVASKKGGITARELDRLIAASALQVPPAYQLESYVINSGNTITATSHVRLRKNGAVTDGMGMGDGPIDASFIAIEQIAGRHYELDDFQIRAVTEGREAMGETLVRLRAGGKLYSGRGISTDIVGSSVMAYINALNKIVYEENEA